VDAAEIIARLGLAPHPEGGWYRETWRAPAPAGIRHCGTAIYFLLEAHQASHWHRVDAAELWLWHAGVPLELALSADGRTAVAVRLGPDLASGEEPQRLVPAGTWQAARPLGGWVLVSCTVSPGFRFEGFELAPPGWAPDPFRSPPAAA
jgi:hypothetical protein